MYHQPVYSLGDLELGGLVSRGEEEEEPGDFGEEEREEGGEGGAVEWDVGWGGRSGRGGGSGSGGCFVCEVDHVGSALSLGSCALAEHGFADCDGVFLGV